MRRRAAGIVWLAWSLGVVPAAEPARQESSAPAVALPPDLERVLRDYERAWQARDPHALANLFAEDGYVLPNSKPPARGRAEIREAYARAGGPLWLRPLAFEADGRVAYIVGIYGHEADRPASGKFVLALKRGSTGRWLIAADVDNSNTPRPAP